MSTRKILLAGLAGLLCVGLTLSIVIIVLAASGGGGTQADPFVIDSLPFSETVDTSTAMVGAGDPMPSCTGWDRTATRWYAFTPAADMQVKLVTGFSYYYNTTLTVFMADGSGALAEFYCAGSPGEVNLTLAAGQKYLFMLGGYAWGPDPYAPPTPYTQSPSMSFKMIELIQPANDSFANAQVIHGLPFTAAPELSLATVEPSEPSPSCWGSPDRTVWYAFTPTTNATLTAYPNGAVAMYTGDSLANLIERGCGTNSWYRFTFQAQAGVTYYFQVWQSWSGTGFTLDLTPPPFVLAGYDPVDPSVYDSVTLVANILDPGNMEIQSVHWNFGDGTGADGWSPRHTYAADLDYTATVTVTTYDGRSATASVVVPVRTHEISIAGFQTPTHVKAGQSHKFVVDVVNTHYLETVKVELYKNTPSGFTLFAALVQDAPAGKPTAFKFDYTFTQSDEASGIDTFQAVATLIGPRDALPANNVLIIGPSEKLKALNDWTFYSGKWGIVDGQLTTTADWSENWVWAGKPPLTFQGDLTAKFNLKLSGSNGYYPGRDGGVMFFASAPTNRLDPGINGYTITWVDGYAGELWLTRWDQGQAVTLAVSTISDNPNPPLQWVVEVQGEWIRSYGDGVLRFEVQDNTYRSGFVGFYAYPNVTKIELSSVRIGKDFRSLMKK